MNHAADVVFQKGIRPLVASLDDVHVACFIEGSPLGPAGGGDAALSRNVAPSFVRARGAELVRESAGHDGGGGDAQLRLAYGLGCAPLQILQMAYRPSHDAGQATAELENHTVRGVCLQNTRHCGRWP